MSVVSTLKLTSRNSFCSVNNNGSLSPVQLWKFYRWEQLQVYRWVTIWFLRNVEARVSIFPGDNFTSNEQDSRGRRVYCRKKCPIFSKRLIIKRYINSRYDICIVINSAQHTIFRTGCIYFTSTGFTKIGPYRASQWEMYYGRIDGKQWTNWHKNMYFRIHHPVLGSGFSS